jgi:transcriptional antiterminator RfaH
MSHWFLAQVKPNADAIARRNLERQHFATFQPLERRTRVKGGRFVSENRPFFPGYLFLSYPEAVAPWSLVNSTYGVSRLVSFAGKPAMVPDAVMAQLQGACDVDEVMAINHQFEPGTQVEIATGTFASFIGEIERLTPHCRVMVLLDFMGKKTRVNLPAANVRVAPRSLTLKAAVQ